MRSRCIAFAAATLAICMSAPAGAVYDGFPWTQPATGPRFAPDSILVKPKVGVHQSAMASFHAKQGAKVMRRFRAIGDLQVVKLPKGLTVADALTRYKRSGLVEYAEPDYVVKILQTEPNDPYYQDGKLWGLNNEGQDSGTEDADIDAPEGWDTRYDAAGVVVAVIDTGVRYTHQDLSANMWTNSDEGVGDANSDGRPGVKGVDDDGDDLIDEDSEGREPNDPGYTNDLKDDDDENGYIDDIQGYDFCTWDGKLPDNDPMDDHGHGTHCAGTIGAKGNNGVGVVGVAWGVQIMPLKFINSIGRGKISDAIACIDYAVENGADILSNSWGYEELTTEEFESLADAIRRAKDAGVIFVAAAGNNTSDNDEAPLYPSCYGHVPSTGDIDNLVAVAATDRDDFSAGFSCYGQESVDLGAPGVDIYSTYGYSNYAYTYMSGTSMATPHVAGALALLKAEYNEDSYRELMVRLFQSTDSLPDLEGKCVTQGRLNLDQALTITPVDLFTTPKYGFLFGGPAGGPFVFSSRTYRISNDGGITVDWTASKTQSWLSISSAGGRLEPRESVALEVWINSNANSLSAGIYNDTITITNTTTGSGNTTRGIELRVCAGPMHVAADGNDSNDGSSWAQAKETVQAGIDAAWFGQDVWVAQGIYEERIGLRDGVRVYGGFSGSGTERNPAVYTTVLDGSGEGSVVTANALASQLVEINGFTIRNGRGTNVGGYGYGGGLYLDRGSLSVTNNVIVGNAACYGPWSHPAFGGGACCTYGEPVFADNTFKSNSSYGAGGLALLGSHSTIANNTFVGNSDLGIFGTVNVTRGSVTFANNLVASNTSGVIISYAPMSVYNNCVYDNPHFNWFRRDEEGQILPDPTGTNGNISEDPLLADASYGNVHIQSGSPCINAGNNSYVIGDYDIDWQNRVQSGTVDIGSDESNGSTWPAGPYAIVRVSPTGDDANDGSTWGLAKQTLKAAIGKCALAGGEVWAKSGTYQERFILLPYACVYGGFTGTESSRSQRPGFPRPDPDPNESTADGQNEGSVVMASAAGQLVSTLDGFTVTNGTNNLRGGGVSVDHCSVAVANSKIISCTAGDGGGMYFCNSDSVVVGNTVSGNTATADGGGIRCWEFSGQLLNNIISGNSAANGMGGGLCHMFGNPTIADNLITGNDGLWSGGAWLDAGYQLFANNTIVGNTTTDEDMAALTCFDSSGTVANNIVAFNSSGIHVSPAGPLDMAELRNNDVYGNTLYNYSPVTTPGETDIQENPLFVDWPEGDYHIQSSSPCRDAGDDDYAGGSVDMDLQPRIQGAGVDIGADEYSQVLCVSPSGNDGNSGRSWSQAKRSVSVAYAVASPGEEVWVAAGLYIDTIQLKEGVSLYGGFAGTEGSTDERDPEANVTTLDADYISSVITSQSGVTRATVLDGFTITGGYGTYVSGVRRGGGIYLASSASPTISNNKISGNVCEYASSAYGGGIFCGASCAPAITGNTIQNNTVTSGSGGGICCDGSGASLEITGNVISSNHISGTSYGRGAGIYIMNASGSLVESNMISGNTVSSGYCEGGGIACYNDSSTIIGNQILDNAAYSGGGIYCRSSESLIQCNTISGNDCVFCGGGIQCWDLSGAILNNVISENTSDNFGGGIYYQFGYTTIADNLITDNDADEGGGVWLDNGEALLVNNTIAGNTATGGNGGGLRCFDCWGTVANNIVAFNNSGISADLSFEFPDFIHNDVYGNTLYNYSEETPPGEGDIQLDPLFVNRPLGDYHIQSGSPCRDAGDDDYAGGSFDMDWQPRIQGTVDIGADEYAEVFVVSPTGDNANEGRSWAAPKLTIQNAIDTAASGDEIWVAAGTYEENITLKAGVSVYGGFAGDEGSRDERSPETNETIVDGGDLGSVVTSPSGVTSATVIDGFTITNGSATYGAGVKCQSSSPTISNNHITANNASNGAGLYWSYGSAPSIIGNSIVENVATSHGGGIYNADAGGTISGNEITDNQASNGGGMWSEGGWPEITANTITGNQATSVGGGIGWFDFDPYIANNVIADNSAANGGGLWCGGYSWATVVNNTLSDNSASSQGGGVFIEYSTLTLRNNIVVFGSSGIYAVGSSVTLEYNDVYGNTSYDYSGLSRGQTDISEDPLFVNRAGGNYHLNTTSPCVDSGTNTGAPATDKDGVTRPQDGDGEPPAICDIGAYELPEPEL